MCDFNIRYKGKLFLKAAKISEHKALSNRLRRGKTAHDSWQMNSTESTAHR